MASILDYSTTPGSNTTVGGVSVAEGMQAGLVNNAMRAMMADTRKWQLDWSGIVTGGTGDAYTITTNQGISAYVDGLRFTFRADRANTGAATLNVDSQGAKGLRKVAGALTALAANDLVADAVYDVVYDASSDVFVIVGFGMPTISAFAATILDDADAATARTTLGAQAADGTLTSLSGLSLAQGDTIHATAADTVTRLAKGTAAQFYMMNDGATAPVWGAIKVGIVVGQFAQNTSGSDYPTGSFGALELNTRRYDTIGITVASNQITFATAGTYLIWANNVAYNGSGGGRQAQVRLYNVTTATNMGTGQVTNSASATPMSLSVVTVATVTDNTVIEFQGRASNSTVLQHAAGNFTAEFGSMVCIMRMG